MDELVEYTLKDIPKFSLNELLKAHWGKKKKWNETMMSRIISARLPDIDFKCKIRYDFYFAKNPLDATNCAGMAKVIEDQIVLEDEYNKVFETALRSDKSDDKTNYVVIKITRV